MKNFISPDFRGISRMTPPLQDSEASDLQAKANDLIEQAQSAVDRTETSLDEALKAALPADHDQWSELVKLIKADIRYLEGSDLRIDAAAIYEEIDDYDAYGDRELVGPEEYQARIGALTEHYEELQALISKIEQRDEIRHYQGDGL